MAINPNEITWDTAPQIDANSIQWDNEPKKEESKKRSFLDEAIRQAGLTGRYLTEGLTGTADVLASPVRTGLNAVLPQNLQIPTTSDVAERRLNLPKPETTLEKAVAAPSRALASTLTGSKIAGAFNPTSELGQTIQQAFTSNMPTQAASAIGGGLGAEAAKGIGGGAIGQTIGGLIGGGIGAGIVSPKPIGQSVEQLQNVNKDRLLKEAQKEGYIALPSDVGAGKGAKALETISGKYKSEELASSKNQNIANNLTRKYLGLPESAPINTDTLSGIRSSVSPAYEAVKNTGVIDLGESNPFSNIVESIQSTPAGKDALMREVKPKYFIDSKDAVDQIKQLRATGDAYYKSGTNTLKPDPEHLKLGRKYIAEANRLENILEDHVNKIGQPDLIKNLRDARQEIAKTYTVQNALIGENLVDYRKIGKMMDKKPITGELALAGKFAKEFPRVNKPVAYEPPAFTLPDVFGSLVGMGVDAITGIPLATGLPAARVGSRYLMESAPFQQRYVQPQYKPKTAPFVPYQGLLNNGQE
jgi:hypothetical protein